MTREGFSEMLVTIRETSGISKAEMCRLTGFLYSTLRTIEQAKQNYGIGNIVLYVKSLNTDIALTSSNDTCLIRCPEDFANWLDRTKTDKGISLRKLAPQVGCSLPTLGDIVRNKYKVKIDLLLKLVDYFGYTIEFKPIQ